MGTRENKGNSTVFKTCRNHYMGSLVKKTLSIMCEKLNEKDTVFDLGVCASLNPVVNSVVNLFY